MKTIKFIIAEDEIAIATLIKSLIDFERLNLEFKGIALNGRKAFELIESEQPDIVITDISMPFISGLELIEKVHQAQIKTHFIIISGLTYFDHALTAIKLGVEDYLLKPINGEELNDVLEKTVMKIATSLKIDYQIKKLNMDSHMQTQKLRRSFLMDILYSKQHSISLTAPQINKDYGFSFAPDSSFLMGVAQIDEIGTLNLATQNILLEQLMRTFLTTMKARCTEAEVYNKNNQFIFLLNYAPENEAIVIGAVSSVPEALMAFLSAYEQLTITISCGIPADTAANLPYSLKTAYEVLNARILSGSQRTLLAREFLQANKQPDFILSQSELNTLRSNIELKDHDKTAEILNSIFRSAAKSCMPCPHKLLELYRDTVSHILSDLHQHKIIQEAVTGHYLKYCDHVEQYADLKKLINFTVQFICGLLPMETSTEQQDNHILQIAKTYMEENYNKNLKLEDVAEQVYLTPSYFGVLFKKEVGEPFSSYLTTLRIEKAKELLQDHKYNIAQISYEVGYQDKRYFSKLFKEQVGVTPKEYRKIYFS